MFQLEASETLSAGLRRLLLQQIDLARDRTTTSTEPLNVRVHEARKAFKRSRALLRFVRDELGAERYAVLNRIFRDAGRRLATHRTDWVLRELARRFAAEAADPDVADGFVRLGASLERSGSDLPEELDTDGQLAAELSAAREAVAGWPVGRDDFDLVRPGVARVYRTGRRRMRAAQRDPTGERFHEWRKAVKYLWHQVEVLAPTNPTPLGPLADAIHSLADLLGDEHDLCDLLRAARAMQASVNGGGLAGVEQRLEEARSRIRHAVWPVAEAVYCERPQEFASRLAEYWDEWRVEAVPQGAAQLGA